MDWQKVIDDLERRSKSLLAKPAADNYGIVSDTTAFVLGAFADAFRAGAPINRAETPALLDRLEHAAMAYERLGKVARDDEKSRKMRMNAMAELAAARKAIADALGGEA